jgi:hypothetical protein
MRTKYTLRSPPTTSGCAPPRVTTLDAFDAVGTLPAFAADLASEGLAFLWELVFEAVRDPLMRFIHDGQRQGPVPLAWEATS